MLIRPIVTLIALAVSLAANVYLIVDRAGEADRQIAACALRAAEARAAAYATQNGILGWVVQQTVRDNDETLAKLDKATSDAERRLSSFRAKELEVPPCGPGQARIDARNEMLGHKP
jgi:hypothetical protein